MQIGNIVNIDNAKQNLIEKNQVVQEAKTESKIIDKDEYRKGNIKEMSDKNEVMLDNIMFGYNRESKDFFVKVTRGDIERKFPTEDMMKAEGLFIRRVR